MHTLLLCLASAVVSGDVGWQRMPDGSMEYIIQLEPQALDSLRDGRAIQSDLHPDAGEVRSYRIVVGNKTLPRDPKPPAATPKPPDKAAEAKLSDPKEPKDGTPRSQPNDSSAAAHLGGPMLPKEPPAADKAVDRSATAETVTKGVESQPEQPEKPWMTLWATLLGLFASIGLNVFLGWIAWDCCHQPLRTQTSAQTTAQHPITIGQPPADPGRSPG